MKLSDFRVVAVCPRRVTSTSNGELRYHCAVYKLLDSYLSWRYTLPRRQVWVTRLRTVTRLPKTYKALDSARAYAATVASDMRLPLVNSFVGEAAWEGRLVDTLSSTTASEEYKDRVRQYLILQEMQK